MRLTTQNNLALDPSTVYTYTDSNLSAGASTVPVKNINSFINQYAIQIGKTGEAETEIELINGAPSNNALVLQGTTRFEHSVDMPVYQIVYDQVVWKRSTTGTAGAATPIGTVDITPNLTFTEFIDTSGAATYAYKSQYRNSLTGDVSAESDWFVPGGPSFYSLQSMRQRVKNKLFSADYLKDDSVIDEWINEWLEEMNTAAVKVNKDYLLGTTSVSFGTAGYGTITADDFMYPRKVEVAYNGQGYANSVNIPMNQYGEEDQFVENSPKHSWQGDTLFRILPPGNGGTARITYAKGEAILQDDADELPFPMRRYTRSFVNYALGCAYENDQKENLANTNYTKAQKIKADFINEITPRDMTGPQTIQFVEGLSGNDDDILGADYIQ